MPKKLSLAAALLSGVALQGQSQNPPAAQPAAQPSAARVVESPAYVRRISAGASLSVLGLSILRDRSTNTVTTSPVVDSLYTTTGLSRRVSYGITAQVVVKDRFAANASVFVRRTGYKMETDIYEGTDNPYTTADERRHTVRNEDTRGRLIDVPVVVRYYGKDRSQAGPRWFVEGGGVIRRVSRIKTQVETTVTLGSKVDKAWTDAPAKPAQQSLRGVVGGVGVQFIDPMGVRVVPEVRYTRWAGRTFNTFSSYTQRNQLEAMISLTF